MSPKEKLFVVIDRINELKNTKIELTSDEELELRNLEVKQLEYYSEWKD